MNVAFEISQEDILRYQEEFLAAVDQSSEDVLKSMGSVAVDHLRELDEELGHKVLATLWDQTEPVDDGDSIYVDVYSKASEMTFFDAGWSPDGQRIKRDPRYPISGQMLLEILEGGAVSHFIFAKNSSRLAIPVSSISGRSELFKKQYGFIFGQSGSTETTFPEDVLHPGVMANMNVEQTAELISAGLDHYADDMANEISVLLQ